MPKFDFKKLRFFDVTLRDGLQSMKKIYTIQEKKDILHNIIQKYPHTKNIEIGSMVSSKILPQMNDSIELYKYAEEKYPHHNFFMLIPNLTKFMSAKLAGIKNMSFITSVSNEFQKKNIKQTINDTNYDLTMMTMDLDDNYKTKLYISCVDECPISGKLDVENICHKINNNLHFVIDNICISDTCGTLTFKNFKEILENIDETKFNKISLHLHNSNNPDISDIINYAISKNITMFDVSDINAGGCSVTMNSNTMTNNLNYDFFKDFS